MSKFFEFLRAATTDEFLAKVRVEVQPSREDPEEKDADSSDSDAFDGESEPDEDIEEKEEEVRAPSSR